MILIDPAARCSPHSFNSADRRSLVRSRCDPRRQRDWLSCPNTALPVKPERDPKSHATGAGNWPERAFLSAAVSIATAVEPCDSAHLCISLAYR